MSDYIGLRLIRSLLNEKRKSGLAKNGIKEHDLFDDAHKALKWLISYNRRLKKWPTAKMLEESTGITLPDEPDDFDYICDQIRRRSLTKLIENDLRGVVKILEDRDPDLALTRLDDLRRRARTRASGIDVKSYKGTGKERVEKYKDVSKDFSKYGIPTPWPTMNLWFQGWMNGSLNIAAALTSTGKTWWLCYIANYCFNIGLKVLYVSLEMPEESIARRIDSIRWKIPFGAIRGGSVVESDFKMVEDFVKLDTKSDGDIIIADKKLVQSVAQVAGLCEEHKPDIVLIDGCYRFQGTGKGQWESTVSIVNDLQIYAELSGVPWIGTTQMNEDDAKRPAKGGGRGRAYKIRYGREYVINPDTAIELWQNEDLRLLGRMEVVPLKVRESTGKPMSSFMMDWDFEKMSFDEIDDKDSSFEVSY